MISENLKTLRKRRGFTQEELAARVHVVRQTVSKWEKGLSVPDAETLMRLSEVLEAPVSEILGERIVDEAPASDIAQQLSRINEQLAIKNRRTKRVLTAIAIILASIILLDLLVLTLLRADTEKTGRPAVTENRYEEPQDTAWGALSGGESVSQAQI